MADNKEYVDFINKVGYGQLNNVDVTHDGYPLSVKESKFITLFITNGDVCRALRESGLTMRNIAGKDYIADEITYRLDILKKQSIATADEILQYFTKVMRGEVKDQFGLDAPLSERTSAARELAKRIIDVPTEKDMTIPEIKVTLNWDGI
jgi:phage terminase small subunit